MKNKEISAQKLCAGTASLKDQGRSRREGFYYILSFVLRTVTVRACEAA
ncbi:MAG: hypothetical protein WAN92_04095 [Herbaspirillum sp.]